MALGALMPAPSRRSIVSFATGSEVNSRTAWGVSIASNNSIAGLHRLTYPAAVVAAMTGIDAQRAPLTGVKALPGHARDRLSVLREGQFKASGVSP